MLLALDTATRHSGIALFDGQQVLAELNWYSTDGQTTELLPRLSQLLAWQDLAPAALRAVAVSLGPGSFTGLRVALSAAKGMALAHGLDLVGVPTLDATAYPYLGLQRPVCAVVAAGRGRVYWAAYRATPAPGLVAVQAGEGTGWRGEYRHSDLAGLAASLEEPTMVAGELAPAMRGELATRLGGHALLAPPASCQLRAAAVAGIGWARWRAGEVDDLAALSPIYLREP
jgi:tRNA threonylcarbamoyladenosine biosynthesis protein TsaB